MHAESTRVLHPGDINDEVLEQLFKSFDADNSGTIDSDEMKGLLLGMSLSSNDSSSLQDTVQYYMKSFDTDKSGTITYAEFRKSLIRWPSAALSLLCFLAVYPAADLQLPMRHTPCNPPLIDPVAARHCSCMLLFETADVAAHSW